MGNEIALIKDGSVVTDDTRDMLRDLHSFIRKYVYEPNMNLEELDDKALSFIYQVSKMKADDLGKVTFASVRQAFKESLDADLPVDGRMLAYVYRRSNSLLYTPGWRGYVYQIKRIHPGAFVDVQLLWPEDHFAYSSADGLARYEYRPQKPIRGDFSNVRGGFCYVWWKEQGREFAKVGTMEKEELARAQDKATTQKVWTTWPGEMKKKVIIRRTCKVEFVGNPLMDALLAADKDDYTPAAETCIARPNLINYADVQPLDLTSAQPKAIVAEPVISLPARGEAGK